MASMFLRHPLSGVSNAPTAASVVFGHQGCSARGCLHADPAVGPVSSGAASLLILVSLLSRALFVQLLLNWTVQGDGLGRVAFPGAGRSLGKRCNRRRTFRPKGASLYKWRNQGSVEQPLPPSLAEPCDLVCLFPQWSEQLHLECILPIVTCMWCSRVSCQKICHLIGADLEINVVLDHDNKVHFCFVLRSVSSL